MSAVRALPIKIAFLRPKPGAGSHAAPDSQQFPVFLDPAPKPRPRLKQRFVGDRYDRPPNVVSIRDHLPGFRGSRRQKMILAGLFFHGHEIGKFFTSRVEVAAQRSDIRGTLGPIPSAANALREFNVEAARSAYGDCN